MSRFFSFITITAATRRRRSVLVLLLIDALADIYGGVPFFFLFFSTSLYVGELSWNDHRQGVGVVGYSTKNDS